VAALDACPELASDEAGGYHWFEDADGLNRRLGSIAIAGGRLTLDVTSRPRAERGRALLGRLGRASLRYRSTRYESVAEAMVRREIRSEAEGAAVDLAEAARAVAAHKEQHYRTWPDTPLPALEGRTPRQAARLKAWRPGLVELLKAMESREARGATRDAPAYDFTILWQELGLDRERQ
jgi:hypothetical protein